MSAVKLSANERAALRRLIRRTVRALARKGLTQFHRRAARSAAWKRYADKLIELMATAPVPAMQEAA